MIIDLGILTIKIDVLIVQIINIVLLLMFFKKMIGNTLSEEVEKRRAMTLKLIQADQEYAAMIAQAQAEKDILLADWIAHKKKLITEAVDAAKQHRENLIAKAMDEAASIIDKATKDANAKQRDMDAHFASGVKKTAMAVIQKIFASKKDVQKDYLTGLVDEFSSSYSASSHA